ncbi:MAG: T9SS type A sorting domain-containing protein, partial [Paludibacteraceae bacterium]|nr:T9SS type A sorting domain-containing protein [Paludibacteraceae bacterium]
EIDTTIVISEGDIYEFGENTLSKAGNYREVFTSSVGCDSIVNLTLEVGTGLDGVYVLSLVIVPNPISGGEITYINRDWTAEEMQGLMLEVIDATGKVILREEPMIYPIAVEGLPTGGIYLVRVIDGAGGIHVGRIVVIQ